MLIAEAFVSFLVCISPYMGAKDAGVMMRVAHARGYDVQIGFSEACHAHVFVSDADWISPDARIIGYDENRPLTRARAKDLIVSWETMLLKGE